MGVIGLAIVQMTTPPVVFGQQTENNTAVFSGQVIPAFIGTAYDPSEAYQRLAGLPIYVFAYDSWTGGNFIINNFAVRTQIRLDGSFQAQGLPHGNHYGVYFPFRLEGGSVIRTDCTDPAASPCVGSVTGENVQFRMPQRGAVGNPDPDLIKDIFSYNMGDPGDIVVNTQISGETVRLGPSFLTSETRVDIANNTNTFPLVPTSSIKVTVKAHGHFLESGTFIDSSAYEIVAQRVVEVGGITNRLPVEAPLIKGRTTFPLQAAHDSDNPHNNDRVFQAYAPPGVYAITAWRADGATTYSSYAVGESVNSSLTGLAFLYVQGGDDWSLSLTRRHLMPLRVNQFTLWGRVHTSTGLVVNPTSPQININMRNINNSSVPPVTHSPKMRNESCDIPFWTFNYDGLFVGDTDCNDRDNSNLEDSDPVNQDPQHSYGLFALYESQSVNFTNIRTSIFEAYVDTTGYERNTVSTQQIFSKDGPQRIDLTVSPIDTSQGGILLEATPPISINTDRPSNPSGTQVFSIRPVDENIVIPASGKTYTADMLGQIKIPHADLVPRGRDFAPYDLKLLIKHPYSELFTDYGCEADSCALTYTGELLAPASITLAQKGFKEPEPYKFLGLIPADFLMPNPPTALANVSADHAHIEIAFTGADYYQSVVYLNNAGQVIDSLDESTVTGMSGNWTLNLQLPYVGPRTCSDGSVMAMEACRRDVDTMNTYTVVATADETVLSKTFRVQYNPGEDVAYATDPSWTFDFTNECDRLEADLKEQLEAEKQSKKRPVRGLDFATDILRNGLIDLEFSIQEIQDVHLPRLGCNASLSASRLAASGLQTLQSALIMEPLTVSIAVLNTWETIRGLANVFFIFILLIIGINQILGLDQKTWTANTMLPQLIVGIILANVSLLLVQFVLDVNNILTAWIFSVIFGVLQTSGISANAIAGVGLVGTSAATFSFLSSIISGGIAGAITSIAGTGGTILIPILGAIIAGAFVIFALVISILATLYGRYLIIWILTMVAPIIFAISVLPWGRSMRNMWWKTVIPISSIQTIVAVLLSIGILLLSKGVEADGLLNQAGVFLIGGATLFMATKAPQFAVQLLGAGGMAGAALGALTAVGSKLGGVTQAVGQKVSHPLTAEGIAERQDRKATLQGLGSSVTNTRAGRIANFFTGGTLERSAYAKHEARAKIERRQKEIQSKEKAAFSTSVARKKTDEYKGNIQQRLQQQFATEVRPELEIQRDLGITDPRLQNIKAGVNSFFNNSETKITVLNDAGDPVAMTVPEMKAELVQKLDISDAAKPQLLAALNKASDLDNIAKTLADNGFRDPELAKNIKRELIRRAHVSDKANVYASGALGSREFSLRGSRNRAAERQAENTQAAAPQQGGGGGGATRGQS